ncbi:hypothetical protein LXA43DRAFT_898796 [Ganoderma leucocontextum]|nr:hypothetical protein LXA43DRAFT_898796 [Ganoderma leucocontextum]
MITQFAHIALLLYDTFLTMDREVRHIWSRRHASTTAMYIVARYSAMLTHLVILLIATRWSGQNIQVGIGFSAVRVFVLSGKSYWQSLVVFVFGLYLSAMYLVSQGEAWMERMDIEMFV